jgi:hypothetical protein
MVNQMRVLSTPRTAECADRVMLLIIDTYFSPNKSMRELMELIRDGGAGVDPLRRFSEEAREELRQVNLP